MEEVREQAKRQRIEARDWDDVSALADDLPPAWRRHARDAHLNLVDGWVGAIRGRWLKTDLFEERAEDRGLLAHLGGEWVGIDVSPKVVAAVATQKEAQVGVADVRRLPFADESFDGILSTSTLDHFEDRSDIDRSLAELRRVIARDGRLVLTLDNPTNPLIRLRNALPERLRGATGLSPFFVGETLSAAAGISALERAGFDVLQVSHLLHAPHVIGTRLARFDWYAREVLPRFDRLGATRFARYSGHFVAFLARPLEA